MSTTRTAVKPLGGLTDAQYDRVAIATVVVSPPLSMVMPSQRTDRWHTVPDVIRADYFEPVTVDAPTPAPVVTGVNYHRHPQFGLAQRCVKCNATLAWGGFAGDEQDFAIAGMVHWYECSRWIARRKSDNR